METTVTVRFNINDNVQVRLTEVGVARYNDFYREIAKKNRAPLDWVRPMLAVNGEGWSTLQFSDLMRIFGPEMYMGGSQFFFDNIIRING